jgi:deoxyribonuclease-4
VSVAGGFPLAVSRARALGCDALQLFARNPNRWQAPPIGPVEAGAFRDALETAAPLGPAVSHASYLINLAASGEALRSHSLEALGDELDRAATLGLLGVVLHPGSRGAQSESAAIERIASGLRTVFRARRRTKTMILLEHTAGQGNAIGHRFEHLRAVIERLDGSPRLGVCLDTCHLLSAGYDISSARGYRRTFLDFDRIVGLDRLVLFHVNDSKTPCGSHVDRHAHIGEGFVGLDAFRRLVNDRRFRDLPMLLETEKLPVRRPLRVEADPFDVMNLARLRALVTPPDAGGSAPRGSEP